MMLPPLINRPSVKSLHNTFHDASVIWVLLFRSFIWKKRRLFSSECDVLFVNILFHLLIYNRKKQQLQLSMGKVNQQKIIKQLPTAIVRFMFEQWLLFLATETKRPYTSIGGLAIGIKQILAYTNIVSKRSDYSIKLDTNCQSNTFTSNTDNSPHFSDIQWFSVYRAFSVMVL
jgi:hypothetical protein